MEYNKEKEMKKIINCIVKHVFILVLFVNISSAMTATVNIPEKYSEVIAGEKIYFETEIKWPENEGRKDLKIEYSIKNQTMKRLHILRFLKQLKLKHHLWIQ